MQPATLSKNIPDDPTGKNKNTKEASWEEYRKNREGITDKCTIKQRNNWHGDNKCRFGWECKGASVCEVQSHGQPGVIGIGWCKGPDACEIMDGNGKPTGRFDVAEWDLS